MRHAVIIRMKYPADYPHLEFRLKLLQDKVLPCFLNQGCQEFDLWVMVDEKYRERVEKMSSKIKTFTSPLRYRQGIRDIDVPSGKLPDGVEYEIQTRHDCDDLCCPQYIEKIQSECTGAQAKLISFRPYIYDLASGKRYFMNGRPYDAHKCSMFLSLYQPNVARRKDSIYSYSHIHIWKFYPGVVTVPEGYCDMVIHGTNLSNSKRLFGKEVAA